MQFEAALDRFSRHAVRSVSRLAAQQKTMVLCCGLLGFVLPTAFGLVRGLPEPRVHDEFSYALSADTFSYGRLTNPTHPFWEHFASPHILHRPTYQSKYPPGQGVVLAAGQVLLGHPSYGIWIGVGLASAACCWMLQAWVPPRWALVGTLFMIFSIGITSRWAQGYWGGMVAVAGGALLFGGLRRVIRDAAAPAAMLMAAGLVILANTRPFEGAVVALPAFVLSTGWLFFGTRHDWKRKLQHVLTPALVVLLAGAAWMLYYNRQVTGSAWTLPYEIHQQRYFRAPLFIFQPENARGTSGHERLRRFYDDYSPKTAVHALDRLLGLIEEHPRFLLGTLLLGPCLLALPWLPRDRWAAFALGTWLLLVVSMSLATFSNQEHYAAPVTVLLYFVAVEAFRHLRTLRSTRRVLPRLKCRYILALIFVLWLVWGGRHVARDIYFYRRDQASAGLARQAAVENLRAQPGNHLVIVQYSPEYSIHDEWVYNAADIDASRIVWAHDLGERRNQELVNYFSNRRVWRLSISDAGKQLVEMTTRLR